MSSLQRLVTALLLLSASLMLEACTLAPAYHRPDAPIPNVYAEEADGASTRTPPWREFFGDSVMRRLMDMALANNRDLRIALLNIEKTRAQYRVQRADLLPTINAVGSESMQHLPADLSSTGSAGFFRQYSATLGFSAFELDLFGRIRSLTEQALEIYHSVANDAQSARLTLMAEVAGMYLQLVADRELYDLAAATCENRKGQLTLISGKFKAGIASALDVSQARGIMEEARADMARYATRVGKDENTLALLLGAPIPPDLPLARKLTEVAPLADVPAGLPSSLLERRPDILSAEHILKGANANIGAARANFFPTISLTGNLGTVSTDFAKLFSNSAHTWSFLPQVILPIFDTGRNIALLQQSTAERDMAVARYEKSIQTAFREVADCLTQRAHIGELLDAGMSLVDAAGKSYTLATVRYTVGVDSYLNVLDSQRSLYSAQSALISARLLRETNALTLYKALGGGWK